MAHTLTYAITPAASLIAMLVISLEQVRSVDHFYLNASNFYISLTGLGAMGLIMLAAPATSSHRRRLGHMSGCIPAAGTVVQR